MLHSKLSTDERLKNCKHLASEAHRNWRLLGFSLNAPQDLSRPQNVTCDRWGRVGIKNFYFRFWSFTLITAVLNYFQSSPEFPRFREHDFFFVQVMSNVNVRRMLGVTCLNCKALSSLHFKPCWGGVTLEAPHPLGLQLGWECWSRKRLNACGGGRIGEKGGDIFPAQAASRPHSGSLKEALDLTGRFKAAQTRRSCVGPHPVPLTRTW